MGKLGLPFGIAWATIPIMPMVTGHLLTNPYFIAAVVAACVMTFTWLSFLRLAMPSPAVNWMKLVMTLGVVLNTYMIWLFFITNQTRLVLLNNLYITSLAALTIGVVYFTIHYAGKTAWLKHWWVHSIIFIPTIALVYGVLAYPNMILGGDYTTVRWMRWGIEDLGKPRFFWLYLTWMMLYFAGYMSLLIWKYRHTHNRLLRRQALIVVIGSSLPMACGVMTIGILSALDLHIPPLNPYGNIISFGLFSYALIHYGSVSFDPSLVTNSIVRTMSNAALVLGQDNRVVYANPAANILFGTGAARLMDKPITKLLPADVVASVTGSGGVPEAGVNITESEITLSGGERRAVNIYSSQFLDHSGRTLGTVLVLADVQHLKDSLSRADQLRQELEREKSSIERVVTLRTRQLADEKARFTASVNSLRFGLFLTDQNDKIIYVNNTLRQLFDLPGHLSSGDLLKHLKTNMSINLSDMIKSCRLNRQSQDVTEAQYGNKILRILLSPVPSESDPNQIIGTVIMVEDITDRKVLERSRDEFFSIASHELRTPLTAIKGNASIMLQYYSDSLKDPSLREMVDDIHESSERLIGIVNDFLDVSRLEQGRASFKLADVALDEIIERVVYEMQAITKEKHISLHYNRKTLGELPMVRADTNRLKQLIYNLLGNATKFTDHGSITIDAHHAGDMVKVTIADTGRGISPTGQQLLFHKFQQAGDSLLTRDTTRGTGLGLYISKMLIENMGGQIALESTAEGKGSVFSFTIPVADR